ncbi:MAG TPA: Gfo/Idh/MocA family oxidoreductase [Ktedonobacteraceae bacterium]|nr:Gfo/Idh/MocA family oxidoreductase [Ktedonobacteraceae bacterium]
MKSRLRIGVVGLRWGLVLARHCQAAGMEVVALYDNDSQAFERASDFPEAVPYQTYTAFLAHEMDAVILAGAFDEHAPLAIQALHAGKHVLSETSACKSIAEGIQLIRAVERTGLVYMFAANYPFKPYVRQIRQLFQTGEAGEFEYGECEYMHSWAPQDFIYFQSQSKYWRARMSSLAYCTHAVSPVMYATDLFPTAVSGFVLPLDRSPQSLQLAPQGRGRAGVMVIHMENGAYVKVLLGFLQGQLGPDAFWLRVHGSRGLLETLRHGKLSQVKLHKEGWASASGQIEDDIHDAPFTENEDLLVCQMFAQAISTGEAPYFDVYRGVTASLVGICGLRSLLNGSAVCPIPDLRQEEARCAYELDDWNGLVAPLPEWAIA